MAEHAMALEKMESDVLTKLKAALHNEEGVARTARPKLQAGSGAPQGVATSQVKATGTSARAADNLPIGALTLDLGALQRLDGAGAWLISRLRAKIAALGLASVFANLRPDQDVLLSECTYRPFDMREPQRDSLIMSYLVDIGAGVHEMSADIFNLMEDFGKIIVSLGAMLVWRRRFRLASFVTQIETFGVRSVPIIALITFLVGSIVAQQGLFQLQRFGASLFAIDLVGIIVLRELGVLLAAIMIAGRSGSAITAEIGSMKMREEIDALKVMGLDPIDVLIIPRVLALVIALPLLTFLADMAAIYGGMMTSWIYAGINPQAYLTRLQNAIVVSTFLSGIIKAPIMGLAIAIIASAEGFAVEGSAESLGEKVTHSVVKSIFTVIVIDGIFAIFFAAINF